jgi:hypothetical protein
MRSLSYRELWLTKGAKGIAFEDEFYVNALRFSVVEKVDLYLYQSVREGTLTNREEIPLNIFDAVAQRLQDD